MDGERQGDTSPGSLLAGASAGMNLSRDTDSSTADGGKTRVKLSDGGADNFKCFICAQHQPLTASPFQLTQRRVRSSIISSDRET